MNYTCTTCGMEKSFDDFYLDSRNTKKKCKAKCKECVKKASKEYKNKVGHSYKDRLRAKKWRNENIDHARKQEKERREANRGLYRAAVMRYATAKRHRVPVWAELEKIKLLYIKAKEWGFEVDHIVPLQSDIVSGLHVWNNLQLIDPVMNRTKSNRLWPDMPEKALTAAQVAAIPTL